MYDRIQSLEMDFQISSADWDSKNEAAVKWVDWSTKCITGRLSMNMVSKITRWLNLKS